MGRPHTTRNQGRKLLDFSTFCASLVLDSGEKLVVETFQRTILKDYFRGVTETVVLLPKKNGKTTLLAALALFHLRHTENAECVIAAHSRDQADVMFKQAVKMIRASGLEDEFHVKGGFREIRYRGIETSRVRVLAADADTADGVIPTLALVDELHRHKSADLYGVFRDGLGPRNGQIITISTAGSDDESPLGVLRSKAYEQGTVERVGPYRRVESPHFVMHEWAMDDGQDVHDLVLVAEANPASWQTETQLAQRLNSPSMTPHRWKRFACNIWTDVEEPWIQEREWDACVGGVDLDAADSWVLGVDVGQVYDSSAVVIAGRVGDDIHVSVRLFDPAPGSPVQMAEVEAYVSGVAESGRVRGIAYDPFRFQRSAEVLEERGLLMVEMPQTNTQMVPASNTLYDLVRERRLVHDGDPDLRRHVMAGVAMEVESGWRISKRKSRKKIDALVALAMAVHALDKFGEAWPSLVEVVPY